MSGAPLGSVADFVRAGEGFACSAEPLRGVGVQRDQRLTRPYADAGLGVQLDPGSRLHGMLLAGAAGSQPPGGLADRQRIQGLQHPVPLGRDHVGLHARLAESRQDRRPAP